MNFRLAQRGRFEHPQWLPSFQLSLFCLMLITCALLYAAQLPLVFMLAPITFILSVALAMHPIASALLLISGPLLILIFDGRMIPGQILPITTISAIIGYFLRKSLLETEWKLAALSLWQTIDESKEASPDLIISEVLREVRKVVNADGIIALRHLDDLTAQVYFSEPAEAAPLGFVSPEVYSRAIASNTILFDNDYTPGQESSFLDELEPKSIVIVPLRYLDRPRGAVLLFWRRKNALSRSVKFFLELIFERLYASLQLSDTSFRLEKLQARYNAILRTMPQGVIFIDESGELVWINPAAARMLRLPEGAVEPQLVSQAMSALRTSADNLQEIMQKSAELFTIPDAAIRNWEWCYSKPHRLVLNISTSPVSTQNAKGRLWMFEDITERKMALEALEHANEKLGYSLAELEQLNTRLVELNSEKNEFMGIAAHDLKNPLSAILGLSQIIHDDTELAADEIREYSDLIVKSSERMFELITQLLNVNAIETGGMILKDEVVELSLLAELIAYRSTPVADKKQIRIFYTAPSFSTATRGDEGAVMQIMENLISNALKFSPLSSRIFVWFEENGANVQFIVKDEGPGISEEDKSKLFGKFMRLGAQPTGGESSTGLGLSIVQKLAEGMGGTVYCESELGRGAKFIVEFKKHIAEREGSI